MPNVIKSSATISAGSIKRNSFVLGVSTSMGYGQTSLTNFWSGIYPPGGGYTVYEQKASQGPSIKIAANDSELITIAKQSGGTNINSIADALIYFNGQVNYLVANMDYPNIVTDGLVLNLDAGYVPSYPRTGTAWNDLSGNSNTGTLTGGSTYSNNAIISDGSGDGVTVSDNATLDIPGSFTLDGWVWFNQHKNFGSLLVKGPGGSGNLFNYCFFFYSNSIVCGFGDGGNFYSAGVLTTPNVPINTWHHISGVYNLSTIKFYLNGTLMDTVSIAATPYQNTDTLNIIQQDYPIDGKINSAKVYNRALSAAEVLQNYQAGLEAVADYYFGGSQTAVNPIILNYIASLNDNGSVDTSFDIGIGFDFIVRVMVAQSDGKILIGGGFTTYKGVSQIRITRLNTNGSLDSAFVVGAGFNSDVSSVALQSDGKIIVGGFFTTYQGLAQNRIARLNTDGSLDSTFVIGTGFNSAVSSIVIQSDGKIMVSGQFSTYKGLSQNYIARLNTDGSLDSTFVIGTGFNSAANSIALQSDGKIMVGGNFSTYKGLTQNRIARLSTDGSLDSTFVNGISTIGAVGIVSIGIQSGGKILIGGSFSIYQGVSRNNIARLNADGSLDSTFVVGTGFDNIVSSIASQSSGKIMVGGSFRSYGGTSSNYVARLNSNGSLDSTFAIGAGFGFNTTSYIIRPDGKMLVGGSFTSYQGTLSNRLTKITNNMLSSSFITGTGFDLDVRSIARQSDGKIIVGGDFTSYQGVSRNNIARLNTDGSLDSTFVVGTGFNSYVTSIALQSDGKILIGGTFTTYKGLSQNTIARLNADGSLDSTFVIGTGFNSIGVKSIALQSDGKILVCGDFTTYKDLSQNAIARLNTDGSLDSTFVIGTGFNNDVNSVALQSDGKILVCGDFITYKGLNQVRIARLNTDGSLDSTFVIGSGFFTSPEIITLQSDGKILVGGAFSTYKGLAQNRIARLNTDGSLDSTFAIGTGFNGGVFSIVVRPDGKIMVGGSFTTYKGLTQNPRVVRLNTDGSLDQSFLAAPFGQTINVIMAK